MTDQLITLPDIYETEIEIVAEAYELRAAALRHAEQIETVEDGFEANQAAEAMKQLADLKKQISEAHKEAKAPVLRISRHIDGLKRDYLDDIESATGRISKLLGAFQAAERKKKIEAEREARKKEVELLAIEKQKQLDAIMDGDQDALAESDKAIVKVQQETRAEIASKHDAVKGVKVRTTINFKVADEAELLKSRSDLFSPDDKKIRAALKITKSIPGLEVWEEQKASF